MSPIVNGTVADKVKGHVSKVEHAVLQLNFVKRLLKKNSIEVKRKIHSSIGFHLETLHCRELQLLEEVDAVVGAEEHLLDDHQSCLGRTLSLLRSGVPGVECDNMINSATSTPLFNHECFVVDNQDVDVGRYIAFCADDSALRNSVLEYGRVDSNGVPLSSSGLADGSLPSVSLPHHVEEYSDSDHHAFEKTLENGDVCFRMPELSTRVEDWLQQPFVQLSASLADLKFVGSETKGAPVVQTKCAIEDWLRQIKCNPDAEDDDFDFINYPASDCIDSDGSAAVATDAVHQQENKSPQPSSAPAACSSEDIYGFFKHIERGTDAWLSKERSTQTVVSLEELMSGNRWFRHIPKDVDTWLQKSDGKRSPNVSQLNSSPRPHIMHEKRSRFDQGMLWPEEEGDFGTPAAKAPAAMEIVEGKTVRTCVYDDCWLVCQHAPAHTTPAMFDEVDHNTAALEIGGPPPPVGSIPTNTDR